MIRKIWRRVAVAAAALTLAAGASVLFAGTASAQPEPGGQLCALADQTTNSANQATGGFLGGAFPNISNYPLIAQNICTAPLSPA
jgi:hypothetical protein